jgi:hypothetical protein
LKEKLKIGILLVDLNIHSWEFAIIESIIGSEFAKLSLIVISGSSNIKDARDINASIIYKLHNKLDEIISGERKRYYAKKNISSLLENVPLITINTIIDGGKETFQTEHSNNIRAYNLDAIINLGFYELKGMILSIPKYGIWSYYIGNSFGLNGNHGGYVEVVSESAITCTSLKMQNGTDKDKKVLYKAIGPTHAFSISINRSNAYKRSVLILPRILKGIYEGSDSLLTEFVAKFAKEDNILDESSNKNRSPLGNLKFLLFHLWILLRKLVKKIIYTDSFNWFILFNLKKKNIFEKFPGSVNELIKLTPPHDKFWADPFVVSHNDKFYIFVEELPFKTMKGHISVIELNSKGEMQYFKPILEMPYHLSYPFVFEFNDSIYMVPETGNNNTIELYRCVNFPDEWEFIMNLMDNIKAKDTTLFYYKDKWWLFTSIHKSTIKPEYSELSLFYSDDLMSCNWNAHPCNPIVSDIRTARCAGKIFLSDENIFRPSQDGSGRYGRALNLNQITVLSETKYEEILVSKVEAFELDKTYKGVHTFNFENNFSVMDAYTYRNRLSF